MKCFLGLKRLAISLREHIKLLLIPYPGEYFINPPVRISGGASQFGEVERFSTEVP